MKCMRVQMVFVQAIVKMKNCRLVLFRCVLDIDFRFYRQRRLIKGRRRNNRIKVLLVIFKLFITSERLGIFK